TAPLATRSSTPTEPPSGNSRLMSPTLTISYSVRNRFRNPLSLGSRMWMGICPPSKVTGTDLRALVPLVPRPALFPLEPSPRPTLVRAFFAPRAGRRSCNLIVISPYLRFRRAPPRQDGAPPQSARGFLGCHRESPNGESAA